MATNNSFCIDTRTQKNVLCRRKEQQLTPGVIVLLCFVWGWVEESVFPASKLEPSVDDEIGGQRLQKKKSMAASSFPLPLFFFFFACVPAQVYFILLLRYKSRAIVSWASCSLQKKTCLSVRVCSVTTRFARATFTCSVNQAKPRQREATFFNAKKKKKREVTLKAAAAAVTERTARDCSTLFRHSPSKAAELEKTFFLFECLIRCFCCVCVGSFGGGGFLPGN